MDYTAHRAHRGARASAWSSCGAGQGVSRREHTEALVGGLLRARATGRVRREGRERRRCECTSSQGSERSAHALDVARGTRLLALRRAATRARRRWRRARASARGQQAGGRHSGRGGHRQEPPVLRIRSSAAEHAGMMVYDLCAQRARPQHAVAADARAVARLLRASEDRRRTSARGRRSPADLLAARPRATTATCRCCSTSSAWASQRTSRGSWIPRRASASCWG